MKNKAQELDSICQSLSEKGYSVVDHLFSLSVVSVLQEQARQLYANKSMCAASVGRLQSKVQNQKVRGDFTFWVDEWKGEALEEVQSYYNSILNLVRTELFLPLKRFESQFCYYPPGTHYDRHKDRHYQYEHRHLSVILYLGSWKPGDGGELMIYSEAGGQQKVNPTQGRWVIFRSELEHEVLPTGRDRWSLTSWFRDDH